MDTKQIKIQNKARPAQSASQHPRENLERQKATGPGLKKPDQETFDITGKDLP